MPDLGIVVIGRNEGTRLQACLRSLVPAALPIVYVDSASTDGSQAFATSLGITLVELDLSLPFTAARARNAGFEKLMQLHPTLPFVQFVDGDCIVDPDWMPRAKSELEANAKLAVVCGRRRERFPSASIYNQLCDMEWNTPIGDANTCGGDSMMRVSALQSVGAFDATVLAGEEPELCMRLRKQGWRIRRIDAEMTLHDLAMTRFSQWWRRTIRGGYGALDVGKRQWKNGETGYMRSVASAWLWGLGWPILFLMLITSGFLLLGPLGILFSATSAIALWLLQAFRIASKIRCRADSSKLALAYGFFTLLGKWPQMQGHLRYLTASLFKKTTQLEYKSITTPNSANSSLNLPKAVN
jgi:cellulose synthase/poly-beta-1,6-N-acetylglucosamine synthase-like glycosyltransferase